MVGRLSTRYLFSPGALALLALALTACNLFDSTVTCDAMARFNVRVEGIYEGRDSIVYVREVQGIALNPATDGNLFGEAGGRQRILVFENEAKVDSSDWFRQAKDGNCHYKPVTVTFD